VEHLWRNGPGDIFGFFAALKSPDLSPGRIVRKAMGTDPIHSRHKNMQNKRQGAPVPGARLPALRPQVRIWRRYFMNWLAILGATLFFFANWRSENIHVNFSSRHGQ
jgi:hypothetical protein